MLCLVLKSKSLVCSQLSVDNVAIGIAKSECNVCTHTLLPVRDSVVTDILVRPPPKLFIFVLHKNRYVPDKSI